MAVGFHADVDVSGPLILQLWWRAVDVPPRPKKTRNACRMTRCWHWPRHGDVTVVTQDLRFQVLAERWRREEQSFAGLVSPHQRCIGWDEMISDLELIAKATAPGFWQQQSEQLAL